jgi:hypothetical protein
MDKPTVIEAVRRFLPAYLSTKPQLSGPQRRAIWAMQACRTAELGGHVHGCDACSDAPPQYAYHSCNHKACPQCGRGHTQQWVQKQEQKRINAPHYMVTFTLPEELRTVFFGKEAKAAYDMMFKAAAAALSRAMERHKHLHATKSGFTMVLHTWNQQLHFHPHIHCIVPGAGLNNQGHYRQVKSAQYLVPLAALKAAFRSEFRELMQQAQWQTDPAAWRKAWTVNVQPFGDGQNAIKYLGAYVGRSVIADSRIVKITDTHVTFRWKDRANSGVQRTLSIPGVEFVKRYLRHVLPRGLHSVRYHGYHHPAAKKTLLKVMLLSSRAVDMGTEQPINAQAKEATPSPPTPHSVKCPCCGRPMVRIGRLAPAWKRHGARGPPA